MTKEELFATYPEGAEDRRDRKHLWVPPGGAWSWTPESAFTTVLAATQARQGKVAVMATTVNAAANIAAYGQQFIDHGGLRLLAEPSWPGQ